MHRLDCIASALARTDFIEKNLKPNFNDVLKGMTGGLPETFSEDHLEELLEKVRERFWKHLLNIANEKYLDQKNFEFGSLDHALIQEAMEKTKTDFIAVDPKNLPSIDAVGGFTRARLHTFSIAKVFCAILSLVIGVLFYRTIFVAWELAGLSGLEKYPHFFVFIAAPSALAFSLAVEHFFRKKFYSAEIFKRIFGRWGSKQYGGKFYFPIILTPSLAVGIFIIAKHFALGAVEFSFVWNIILILPGLIGILAVIFGLLLGGLSIWLIIYTVLVTWVAKKMFGIFP